MPGAPLSLPEREEILLALTEDREATWASLCRRIGRHPSTVAREVTGRGGRAKYRPVVADGAAVRARERPRERLAMVPPGLRERIAAEMRLGRSPEAIWGDERGIILTLSDGDLTDLVDELRGTGTAWDCWILREQVQALLS